MPLRERPGSLKQQCLNNIARNMDNLWCLDYVRHYFDQGTYLYIIGPFDNITPCLICELIDVLSARKLMKTHFLHLLLEPRLVTLNLSNCRVAANKEGIMALIATRCRKLQYLNIGGCNQVLPKTLMGLTMSMPALHTLVLKQTKCSDEVLLKIGQHCTNLRELDVSNCPISDSGMFSLCFATGQKETQVNKLVKLNIMHTAVTVNGAEVVLGNLKSLRWLYFADICEAVHRFAQHAFHEDKSSLNETDRPSNHLQLRYMSVHQMKASRVPVEDSVAISVLLCPFITEISFIRGISDEALLKLVGCKHIRHLTLANDEEQLISFDNGVMPLLEKVGSTIEELNLNDINEIDIGVLGILCPNLRLFTCIIASYSDTIFRLYSQPQLSNTSLAPFAKLEKLEIQLHCVENSFPEVYLKLLIESAHGLKELTLSNVQSLSDAVWAEMLLLNGLGALEQLNVSQCHGVTAAAVWSVLGRRHNTLRHVNLAHCFGITRCDWEQFKTYCVEQGYTLEIVWS